MVVVDSINWAQPRRNCVDQQKSSGKPFDISKKEVWNAWLEVKRNQGAPGVDEQSLVAFEADLKNALYVLRWIMKKYKNLRTWKQAGRAMRDAVARQPRYFAHWVWVKPALPAIRTTRAV